MDTTIPLKYPPNLPCQITQGPRMHTQTRGKPLGSTCGAHESGTRTHDHIEQKVINFKLERMFDTVIA